MLRERLSADLAFCHRRRWAGKPAGIFSRLRLIAGSRGFWLLTTHRLSHWWLNNPSRTRSGSWQLRLVSIPLSLLEWLIKVATKSDILGNSDIDGGICLDDQGGIILGARKVGPGTVIGHSTTIGMNLADRGLPEIGRNVWIGSDCIIYGALTIGDGATLLPGTTLTKSIPAGVVMRGNPARLVRRDFDNTALREQPGLDVAQCLEAMQGT
jgi:serine O-acetyltransferase